MENQMNLSGSFASTQIEIQNYRHYENSVGNNLQSIQITTKCRYKMMKQERFRIYCKIAIEEACKRHKIEILILKVLPEHVHLIVDCPRTMSIAKLLQIIKGLSSYIIFRLVPNFRKRYKKGHFWSEGYFCASCGSDFERAMGYIENQEGHHSNQY